MAWALKIVWLEADLPQELNTSIQRIRTPAKRLAKAGFGCFVSHAGELISGSISAETKMALSESNVIVIERLLVKEIHSYIRQWRDAGKQVWATFDDNYALIPGSVSRNTWRGGREALDGRGSILNEFRQGLRLCTGFMTPSTLLCTDYAGYNSRAEYVPNFLDEDLWGGVHQRSGDIVTIGYGGTSLHNISLKESGVIPALGKLCKRYTKVQVHLQPPYPDVVDAFRKTGVRYTLGNWQRYEDWSKTVIGKFDVGIAPLSGNYDARRSNLKTLEFGIAGIPWVSTDDMPYKESEGGLRVPNKSSAWYSALEDVINHRPLYDQLAAEGRNWATRFNDQCAERYEGVFNGRGAPSNAD